MKHVARCEPEFAAGTARATMMSGATFWYGTERARWVALGFILSVTRQRVANPAAASPAVTVQATPVVYFDSAE